MRVSIVSAFVVATCLCLTETGRTLAVKLLGPDEPEKPSVSILTGTSWTDASTEVTENHPSSPGTITLILGMEGRRGGRPSLTSDVLSLARLVEEPPQPVCADARFDGIAFGPPRSVEVADTSKIIHVVDRTLGEFKAYLVRASTMWIARDDRTNAARDAAFLAADDLELVSAARPVVLVVTATDEGFSSITRSLEASRRGQIRFAKIGPGNLISVTGPAGNLEFIAKAIAEGIATSALSTHTLHETLLARPDPSKGRFVMQFDELEGTTMNDFVETCRERGFEIEPIADSLAERRIRVFVRIMVRLEDLGLLVEDVARALDLVVTGDGNRRRLWEHDEFAEARELAATGLPEEGRDPFAVAVERSAIGSWRHRSTWIEVEVPLTSLTPERAIALLHPVFVDASRDGDAVVRGNAICLRGPAHVVVRNAEIVTAAEKLLVP